LQELLDQLVQQALLEAMAQPELRALLVQQVRLVQRVQLELPGLLAQRVQTLFGILLGLTAGAHPTQLEML
jgi:hypothetical protein